MLDLSGSWPGITLVPGHRATASGNRGCAARFGHVSRSRPGWHARSDTRPGSLRIESASLVKRARPALAIVRLQDCPFSVRPAICRREGRSQTGSPRQRQKRKSRDSELQGKRRGHRDARSPSGAAPLPWTLFSDMFVGSIPRASDGLAFPGSPSAGARHRPSLPAGASASQRTRGLRQGTVLRRCVIMADVMSSESG